jgi:hypothetical protein
MNSEEHYSAHCQLKAAAHCWKSSCITTLLASKKQARVYILHAAPTLKTIVTVVPTAAQRLHNGQLDPDV